MRPHPKGKFEMRNLCKADVDPTTMVHMKAMMHRLVMRLCERYAGMCYIAWY